MSKVKIQGNASGTGVLTVTAPNTSTDRTITLPDSTGTLSVDKSITDNGNATAMTIGADENIGIGVVPKAWHSSGVALQVGAGGCVKGHTTDERVALLSNAYEAASDGNWKRVLTGLAANVNIDNGVVNFETAVTGSADSNITWTNPVQIDSEGIKFNGDTAAANALDDYEIGTWSPTLQGGTFENQITTGRYIKIGNLVHIQYYSSAVNISNASGAARITNLPYAPNNVANYHEVISYAHGTAVVGAANLYLDHSNATMYFVTNDSTSSPSYTNGTNKYLMVSGTYQTA